MWPQHAWWDPSFPANVGTLRAMGGAEEKGNVTAFAEWNFHCDPEAAYLVSPDRCPRLGL